LGNFTQVGDASLYGETVAFVGRYFHPESGTESVGVFLGSGGPLTTLIKSGDAAPIGAFSEFGNPSFDGNRLAFHGRDGGGSAIYKYQNGTLTLIARIGDTAPSGTFDVLSDPLVGGNTVAFIGSFDESLKHGLFTSVGGDVTPVIKTGDSLFGSTLVQLVGSPNGLREFALDSSGSGTLAFTYRLADGRFGLAIARPVPEPSSCALALLCFAGVALVRRVVEMR
jgi:hypothetical protein